MQAILFSACPDFVTITYGKNDVAAIKKSAQPTKQQKAKGRRTISPVEPIAGNSP
ncbi:MAG: hypothetical protein ABL865_01265 [Candidatus Nitrotoga sp.]